MQQLGSLHEINIVVGERCCFAMWPCGEAGPVDEDGSVELMLDIKLGIILGGDSDSWRNSEEGGFVDRRLAAHFGVKHLGSAYPPRRD